MIADLTVTITRYLCLETGDFVMDTARFPTMTDTIKILQRRGFKIVLSIHPFISTESYNFKTAVKEKLLVMERNSDQIPALTRYVLNPYTLTTSC